MANREDFLKQLEELLDYAKAKESKLTKKEINDYFSEMNLSKEQFELVYAYMAEHNVEVAGFAKKESEDGLSTQDSKYLRIYRKEINQLVVLTKEEQEALFERLKNGEDAVINQVVESYLKRVVTLATKYKNRGVFLEDLIQEGNIALIEAVNELCGDKEITNHKKELDRRIRRVLIDLVDEAQEESGMENSILAKTNLIHEATKVLAEDLGRVANIHELADYTKMSEEEIADIVDLALDEIKIGDCGHDHHEHHE